MIVGTTGAVDALGHPHTDNDENEYEEATDDKHKETTMAKKKVKPAPANEDPLTYGMPQPRKRPGRQAKPSANLAAALDDIESYTAAWIRRFDDVWFGSTTTIPPLEFARNAPTYDGIPERYDNAIKLLELLADHVEDAIRKLEDGKAIAKKELARERASRGKPKSAKK